MRSMAAQSFNLVSVVKGKFCLGFGQGELIIILE
jgi:hypothetical protein